jgi:hypothetical protein
MPGTPLVFARRRIFPLALALSACGADDARLDASPANGGDGLPASGALWQSDDLTFVESELILVPGQTHDIGVKFLREGAPVVRLTLLGDSRDAYLHDDQVRPGGEDRTAWTRLTAPSEPAYFVVRATLETGEVAEMHASTGAGLATLIVVPRYEQPTEYRGARREVTEWVATVRTGRVCQSYSDIPPPDGDLVRTSPADDSPVFEHLVPAGVPLTITARAGQFIGGCTELSSLVADVVHTVQISVADRPMQMGQASFSLALGIRDHLDWRLALASVSEGLVSDLTEPGTSDVTLVLDRMLEEIEGTEPTLAANMATERAATHWDILVQSALGPEADTALRRPLRNLLLQGHDRLVGDSVVLGSLHATPEQGAGTATFTFDSVGGVPALGAGFPGFFPTTWRDSGGDWVQLGGRMALAPARLSAILAEARAGSAEALAEQAADRFGCTTLAAALSGEGIRDLTGSTCDPTCLKAFCEDAVRVLWASWPSHSDETVELQIAASGASRIDDQAVPIGFEGEWVASGILESSKELRIEGSVMPVLTD